MVWEKPKTSWKIQTNGSDRGNFGRLTFHSDDRNPTRHYRQYHRRGWRCSIAQNMCSRILLIPPPKSKTPLLQCFPSHCACLPKAPSIPCRKPSRPVFCQTYYYLLGLSFRFPYTPVIANFHPPTPILLSEEFLHGASFKLEQLQQRIEGCTLEYHTFTHPWNPQLLRTCQYANCAPPRRPPDATHITVHLAPLRWQAIECRAGSFSQHGGWPVWMGVLLPST